MLRVKIKRLYDLFQINDIDDIINVIPIQSIEKLGDGEAATSLNRKSTEVSTKTKTSGSDAGGISPDLNKNEAYQRAREEIKQKKEDLQSGSKGLSGSNLSNLGYYFIFLLEYSLISSSLNKTQQNSEF